VNPVADISRVMFLSGSVVTPVNVEPMLQRHTGVSTTANKVSR